MSSSKGKVSNKSKGREKNRRGRKKKDSTRRKKTIRLRKRKEWEKGVTAAPHPLHSSLGLPAREDVFLTGTQVLHIRFDASCSDAGMFLGSRSWSNLERRLL